MRVVVVTPPTPVVSLEEAKLHLRVDADDDDTLIGAMVAAATQNLDGPAGWLGRAIGVQTLEANGTFFDSRSWSLPCPPVISIITLEYLDRSGVFQTLDEADYRLRGDTIACLYDKGWPVVCRDDENVRVTYQAGYAQIPAPIHAAILLMVGDLYRFRETAGVGLFAEVPMSTTVTNLLTPYRMWG